MNAFQQFKNDLIKYGLEWFGLYYGAYEGIVVDNDDKDTRGRLKVKCPAVWGNVPHETWAKPRGMFSGKKIGFYALPQVNDVVWITFQGGKPNFPMWEYGWFLKDQTVPGAAKDIFVFATPKGHTWVVDEKNNKIYFTFKDGKTVLIDKDHVKIGATSATHEKSTLGETTKKKLENICDKAQSACEKAAQIQVPTAMGLSGVPTNAADFVQLAADFATIKSELPEILSNVMTNE